MSEFEKVQCTCAHGYTCRAMTDPNCCAHSCDYNDLVDAFNALQAERDAALAQNKRMKNFIRMTSEKFEGDHHVEPSMLTLMRVAKEAPDDTLAAHDAEVAENAVNDFCEWMFLSKRYSVAEWCGEYTSHLRAKAKQ